ncbi:MAG: hypothetical protein ACPGWS_05485 [Solirubrobacterales bacterium]
MRTNRVLTTATMIAAGLAPAAIAHFANKRHIFWKVLLGGIVANLAASAAIGALERDRTKVTAGQALSS